MNKITFLALCFLAVMVSCKRGTEVPDDGTPCDDGIPCTVNDVWNGGKCAGVSATDFHDDHNPCTSQSCDSLTGLVTATNLPQGTTCPDGQCDGMGNCAVVIDALAYMPTLTFDPSGGASLGGEEKCFPMTFLFNTTDDANGDGEVTSDDNLENLIEKSIGQNLNGTGRTGNTGTGPNDQRPVVYFHLAEITGYRVWEYWFYYPDYNYLPADYLNHEHEWTKVFIYVPLTPGYSRMVKISGSGGFVTKPWGVFQEDMRHIVVGVDGGSHAMNETPRNGVKIRWNGEITKNQGTLYAGDGLTIPWRILCNDNRYTMVNTQTFVQAPAQFNFGDPIYPSNIPLYQQDEYGDVRPNPWMTAEWNTPPSP